MGRKNKASKNKLTSTVVGLPDNPSLVEFFEILLDREASLARRESMLEEKENELKKQIARNTATTSYDITGTRCEASVVNSGPTIQDEAAAIRNRSEVQNIISVGNSSETRAGVPTDSGSSNSRNNGRDHSLLSFKDISNALPEFSGDGYYDIKSWIRDLESVSELMKWSPIENLLFAKRLLTGSAKLAIRAQPDLNSWEVLKKFLLIEFSRKASSAEIHRKLAARKQGKDETVYDYFLRMRECGVRGAIDDVDIMQYVIDGINDNPQNKIMLYGATNVEEFKIKLENYRIFKERSTSFKPRDPNRNNTKNIKCFNCGRKGHKSKDCNNKKLGPKCFSCSEYGHKAPDCPKKTKQANFANKNERFNKSTNSAFKIITIKDQRIKSLIDTGSDVTLIREELYLQLDSPEITEPRITLRGLSGTPTETKGAFEHDIIIDDEPYTTFIHVLPDKDMLQQMIIGRDILAGTNISLQNGKITITKNKDHEFLSCNIGMTQSDPQVYNPEYKAQILELTRKYQAIAGKDAEFELNILLKDKTPVSSKPRRLSPLEKEVVDHQITE